MRWARSNRRARQRVSAAVPPGHAKPSATKRVRRVHRAGALATALSLVAAPLVGVVFARTARAATLEIRGEPHAVGRRR